VLVQSNSRKAHRKRAPVWWNDAHDSPGEEFADVESRLPAENDLAQGRIGQAKPGNDEKKIDTVRSVDGKTIGYGPGRKSDGARERMHGNDRQHGDCPKAVDKINPLAYSGRRFFSGHAPAASTHFGCDPIAAASHLEVNPK
jgi:hypothetical protein